MIKEKRVRFSGWVIITVACLLWMTIPPSTALSEEGKTLGQAYPGFFDGILASAKLEKLKEPVLLKADGFEITDAFFKEAFGEVDPGVKKELEKGMLFILDQEVMERLILEDAKSMGFTVEPVDEKTLKSYFDRVTKDVTVSEKAAKSFYDANQEMVGGMPFDQVKESIEGFLLQKKKQEALQTYIETLAQKANMRINEAWVKKQVDMAEDNPLDSARLSGKPTLVQFSSVGCPPCEMMKPILKKLKKKYEGTINVVSIPVDENQMLAQRFNVRAVPVQVFFDKEGKKTHQHMGFMAEADILKQFKKMGAI